MDTNKFLLGLSIAITRPVKQATQLTKLIEEVGGNVISFPLVEIAPLIDYTQFEQVIANINTYDWAIFISSNAVQNGMPRLLNNGIHKQLKFAAIGPVTEKALSEFGVNEVRRPKHRFDSESLLLLPEMHDMKDKKVMIVRGIGGRDVLANTLKSRGAQVTFAECYQRINPQQDCKALAQYWQQQKLYGVVITSSEAMRYYLNLSRNSDWIQQCPVFVNHARIAEEALNTKLQIHVAGTAGDQSMMDNIKTYVMSKV